MPRKPKNSKPKVPAKCRAANTLDEFEISSMDSGSDTADAPRAPSQERNQEMDGPAEPQELADAASKASSNHDYDDADSDQGSITRSRPQSCPQSRPQSRPQSPLPSSIAVSGLNPQPGAAKNVASAAVSNKGYYRNSVVNLSDTDDS